MKRFLGRLFPPGVRDVLWVNVFSIPLVAAIPVSWFWRLALIVVLFVQGLHCHLRGLRRGLEAADLPRFLQWAIDTKRVFWNPAYVEEERAKARKEGDMPS